MASCDLLFEGTKDDPSLASYTSYADTCAGRQPENTQQFCSVSFPG